MSLIIPDRGPQEPVKVPARVAALHSRRSDSNYLIPQRDKLNVRSDRPLIISSRTNRPVVPVLIQLPPIQTALQPDSYELLNKQRLYDATLEEQWLGIELDRLQNDLTKHVTESPETMAGKRAPVALLIAAHNEELVLENTIRSAIAAGQAKKHIYVVDDNSSDTTSQIARSILPRRNVKKVDRSGKGLALMRGTQHFKLTERYEWVHIADADGAFSENYFRTLVEELDPANAAATGYIKSQEGGVISQCRVYEYAIGMELMRRFQTIFGIIPIIPGATSCFRSDVFEKVDFNSGSMTEDFDVTIQIHRQKLGKIQFIPEAIAFTQDPKDLGDYIKQVNRWNRGFMQVLRRHKLGLKFFAIDSYIGYQLFVSAFYILNFLFWIPLLVVTTGNYAMLAVMFMADVIFTLSMVIAAAAYSKRWDILGAFPHIYGMRWLNMALFLKAVIEVFVLRKFRISNGLWDTAGRRYSPTAG